MGAFSEKNREDCVFLSVIIPAYNMSHQIEKCLDSILKQKVSNYEIVVVDDASSDNLAAVLDPYIQNGAPIKPIYLTQNGGVSNARNVGTQAAQGVYIHYVDADDVGVDDAYPHMMKRVQENPCDIIVANYIFHSSTVRDEVRYYASEGLARCLESNNLSLWNKWFKRSFILENGLSLATGMKTAEDALFCFQAYRRHPTICCVNHFLYQYEYDDLDRVRHRERDLHIDSCQNSLRVIKEAFAEPVPEETVELWATAYRNYIAFIYNNIWTKMQDPASKEEAFVQMQDTFRYISECNEDFHLGYGENAASFEILVGCDYMTFVTIDYKQYTLIRFLQHRNGHQTLASGSAATAQLFLEECRQGHVGMKTILKSIKNWLLYKLKK